MNTNTLSQGDPLHQVCVLISIVYICKCACTYVRTQVHTHTVHQNTLFYQRHLQCLVHWLGSATCHVCHSELINLTASYSASLWHRKHTPEHEGLVYSPSNSTRSTPACTWTLGGDQICEWQVEPSMTPLAHSISCLCTVLHGKSQCHVVFEPLTWCTVCVPSFLKD